MAYLTAVLAEVDNEATISDLILRANMNGYKIKQGDLVPSISAILSSLTPGGGLVGAVGVSMVWKIKDSVGTPTVSVGRVIDAAKGLVQYDWQSGDTDVAGVYSVEWRVQFPNGNMTFPNVGFASFEIAAKLS